MDDITKIDPTKLTSTQLKAILTKEGVELPTAKQSKQTYVDLFNSHKSKVLERIRQEQGDESHSDTPRKRKQRHSLNVFQSSGQPANSDEEQKRIKKRKSLASGEETQPKSQTTKSTHQALHLQPQPLYQTTTQQPQLISKPHFIESTYPTAPEGHLGQRSPPPSAPSHLSQPRQPHQSHLLKYQLPPTLFQPAPKQASAKSATYISPLYFSNAPTPSIPTYKTSTISQPQEHFKPLSPSQFPLPPPPSPLPTPTHPLPPLPPPPSPLSPRQFARTTSITKPPPTKLPNKTSSSPFPPYLYVLFVAALWIATLMCLCSSAATYYGMTLKFCDTDSPTISCVPCPPNGTCHHGKLECNPRFVRSGMQCVEDVELDLMAQSVAERMNEIIMEAGGKCKCGQISKNYTTLDELKHKLVGMYPPDKFEEVFVDALRKINSNPRYKHLTATDNKFTTDKVTLSLPCMAKLALYEQLPLLSLLVAGVVLAVTIRYWRTNKAHQTQEINNLVAAVLTELQSKRESTAINGDDDAGIIVEHLRDKLLHGYADRRKHKIWSRVLPLVQKDSRVSEYASFKHGAQVTNWEWTDK